jgi:hypothetical protein
MHALNERDIVKFLKHENLAGRCEARTHQRRINMPHRLMRAALPLLGFVLMASATQALAQQAPSVQIGWDTRVKSEAECLNDAKFAITEAGLEVTFESGPHIGGAGSLRGAGAAVLVTCLAQGDRTFIDVVGTSLDGGAAEEARNRVREITMGPPS